MTGLQTREFTIPTADGAMGAFAAAPEGAGPFPVVIIYMDAPGIREELRGFARRIAARGYYCLLPDLYYRGGRVRFDLSQRDEAMTARIFEHMRSLNNALIVRDTEGMLAALADEPLARDGHLGCIGYCMSGQYVLTVCGTFPERFAAGVSCYGVGIVTDRPDSPHLLVDKVRGEMFFAFAERDAYVADEEIATLRSAAAEHGLAGSIAVYPGTEHGFCFPERAGLYHEASAEDVWRETFALFDRRLSAKA